MARSAGRLRALRVMSVSIGPGHSTLAFTARSPYCGADRIIWASDYPHPDAKIPGIVKELTTSIADLPLEDQARIAGGNALELYRI